MFQGIHLCNGSMYSDATYDKLEALRDRRPPWPRQIIITPIFPSVIMLSLGGKSLTPKVWDHYLHYDLVILPLLWCFSAHLLILEYPDHHQKFNQFFIKFHPNPFITF